MADLLHTRNFELAIRQSGDETSEKMALVLPGRLDTKDYAHIISHVESLGKLGYLALSFDPPGTWESPGGIALYNTKNYLQSILEIIETFNQRPTVVVGHSRGGTLAMLTAVQNPNVTHLVTMMSHYRASTISIQDKSIGYHRDFRDFPPGDVPTDEQQQFDLPLSYFDDRTVYDGMDTCEVPKLFILGDRDEVISRAEIEALFRLAAGPKQLIELESRHNYRYQPEVIEQVNEHITDFLQST